MFSFRSLIIMGALMSFHISFTASAADRCVPGNIAAVKDAGIEDKLKGLLGDYTLEKGRNYFWKISGKNEPLQLYVAPKASQGEEYRMFVKVQGSFAPLDAVCSSGNKVAVKMKVMGFDVRIEINGRSTVTYLGDSVYSNDRLGSLTVKDSTTGQNIAATRASSDEVAVRTAPTSGGRQ